MRNPGAGLDHPTRKISTLLRGVMSSYLTAVARLHFNLPGRKSALPFSEAVLVGETLYLAGRIGIDPVTGRAPADVHAEIKLLLDGYAGGLGEAGRNRV